MSEERLILASASPRRRELMEKLQIPFTCEVSRVEETVPQGVTAEQTAEYLSGIKAGAVYEGHTGEGKTVIGSDTVVVLDGKIYGKPADADDAFRMLRELSGKTHRVLTGVTLLSDEGKESFTTATEVEFYDLSDEEIRSYLETGEPFDKAGAYGIQGYGALLVKRISGDYYTVMGFPIAEIARRLKKRGLKNKTENRKAVDLR